MTSAEQFIVDGVDNKEFPKYLYKYRPIEKYTDEIIVNAEFWFSSPTDFNDPFDCNLSSDINYRHVDIEKYLNSQNFLPAEIDNELLKAKADLNAYINNFETITKNVIGNRGILSLSKIKDNILMWSHYAKNHTGMVFELSLLKDPSFFSLPTVVDYRESYEPLKYLIDPNKSIRTNISTKSKYWCYEEEIRIIKKTTGLHSIKKEAIRNVYFGCETKLNDIERVIKLFQNNSYKSIGFYRAHKVHGKFKLAFSKIR